MARSSSSASRIERAHDDLRTAFKEARKQFDREGFVPYGPDLCDAVAHFCRELLRATGQDEIKRRTELVVERTGKGSRYAEVMADLMAAGLCKYVPMPVLQGFMPRYPHEEFIRSELAGVRRLLGPAGDEELTPQQRSAMKEWERELEAIEEEAVALHVVGCQWLQLLEEYQVKVEGGVISPEKPTVEYDDALQVKVISSGDILGSMHLLNRATIHTMEAAADSLMADIRTPVPPKGLTSHEFNVLAKAYLEAHATEDHRVKARELREYLKSQNPAGTCSLKTISKLPAWRAYQDELELTGRKGKKGKPKAVGFTEKLEATTGKADPELQRLINDQQADEEPSPLEKDPPDGKPLQVKYRKQV